MEKKENKKALPQAEVKKSIDCDDCFMKIIDEVRNIAENFHGEDKICPAEITFSQDMFCYANNEKYISRVNNRGVMQATYYGLDTTKDGHIYVQYFKDVLLRNMSEIQDDKEFEAAQKMLQIGTGAYKKYLVEAHRVLKAAFPNANLFLWASDLTSLHITDLDQEHEFKRMLKKKGLI